METQIRTNMMYLDHLLKQLVNYKMIKKSDTYHDDDRKVIAKKLMQEVDKLTDEMIDELCDPHGYPDGAKFMNIPLKSKYKIDWKITRALQGYETLRQNIINECESEVEIVNTRYSQDISSQSEEFTQNVQDDEFQSLMLKQRESIASQLSEDKSPLEFNVIDYGSEEQQEEQKNLLAACKISSDVNDMQNDINLELEQQRAVLIEADNHAHQAVIESGEALKEVKKGSKGKWTWLPLKLGVIFGLTGGVGGGVAASIPGAAAGGATGAVVGGYVGSQIKKQIRKDIERFEAEIPQTAYTTDNIMERPRVAMKVLKENRTNSL